MSALPSPSSFRFFVKLVHLFTLRRCQYISDFIKALAMGADAVAIGTAALMACCCQQYRVCDTGQCPVGCTTQDPALRSRLEIDTSARRVENFLRACTEELREFCRLTGHEEIRELGIEDLCTTSSEISGHTDIQHA